MSPFRRSPWFPPGGGALRLEVWEVRRRRDRNALLSRRWPRRWTALPWRWSPARPSLQALRPELVPWETNPSKVKVLLNQEPQAAAKGHLPCAHQQLERGGSGYRCGWWRPRLRPCVRPGRFGCGAGLSRQMQAGDGEADPAGAFLGGGRRTTQSSRTAQPASSRRWPSPCGPPTSS